MAIDARVVAIASSIGMLGVAVALPGKEQDVIKIPVITKINGYLICRLYNFSEQIEIAHVY